MKPKKKIITTLYLTAEQRAWFARESKKDGTSAAEAIRKALDEYIQQRQKETQ